MKLIPEWRQAWKLKTVRWSAFSILLTGAVDYLNSIWYSLPPEIVNKIPHSSTVSIVMFMVVMFMRLVKQNNIKKEPDDGSK